MRKYTKWWNSPEDEKWELIAEDLDRIERKVNTTNSLLMWATRLMLLTLAVLVVVLLATLFIGETSGPGPEPSPDPRPDDLPDERPVR